MPARWRDRLIASLCLLLCACSLSASRADEWRGWRGGVREGRSASPHGPLDLSAKSNVVWKTPLPGAGHSSPIVSQDAVYVTTTWNAETDPRVLTVFRCLLLLTLLLIA